MHSATIVLPATFLFGNSINRGIILQLEAVEPQDKSLKLLDWSARMLAGQ
jgi:hypothetical protein